MSYEVFKQTLATLSTCPAAQGERLLTVAKDMDNGERAEFMHALQVLEAEQAQAMRGEKDALEGLSVFLGQVEHRLNREQHNTNKEAEARERQQSMQSIGQQLSILS